MGLTEDFDRGMVPMKCDQREKGCTYELPHYHCKVCVRQVNSDELRRDYHPCCSVECIKVMNIARLIDHTALKPDTTEKQIRKLCVEAVEYGFASVCVNPTWVGLCSKLLTGVNVRICAVIGFPLGANLPETKAYEAKFAVAQGADELDMVINIGALKSGQFGLVEWDIRAVRAAVPGVVLKVIIETCLLTDDEKIIACRLSQKAGADFVKTSTGFSTGGATVEDVRLMRQTVGTLSVKASGFIRTYAEAKALIEAGANRLGCSASVAIMAEAKQKQCLNI